MCNGPPGSLLESLTIKEICHASVAYHLFILMCCIRKTKQRTENKEHSDKCFLSSPINPGEVGNISHRLHYSPSIQYFNCQPVTQVERHSSWQQASTSGAFNRNQHRWNPSTHQRNPPRATCALQHSTRESCACPNTFHRGGNPGPCPKDSTE